MQLVHSDGYQRNKSHIGRKLLVVLLLASGLSLLLALGNSAAGSTAAPGGLGLEPGSPAFMGLSRLPVEPNAPGGSNQRGPCLARDPGTGTADLPVEFCKYVPKQGDQMFIIDGLPPGTTIELNPTLHSYMNVAVLPGGNLGGNIHQFDAILSMEMKGTGDLAGFQRDINIPVLVEFHTAPASPGDPVQVFNAELVSLQGSLFGDPDFDTLSVAAGFGFGLPSPGQVTLTKLPDGNFQVDSFFDITYQVDFVGAPGSALDGLSGTTTGNFRMETVALAKCIEYDSGNGSVYLPPETCGYESGPGELMSIIDGLPPGTTIMITPTLHTVGDVVMTLGGTLGGEIYSFEGVLQMEMVGYGDLAGYNRSLMMPVDGEIHTAPHVFGDPLQVFPTDFVLLQGLILGDPDFESLMLTAGTGLGLPSPGQTGLTQLPGGDFMVDSFFDITYQIDFVGAPGSVLEGLSGSTLGPAPVRIVEGRGLAPFETYIYLPAILKDSE